MNFYKHTHLFPQRWKNVIFRQHDIYHETLTHTFGEHWVKLMRENNGKPSEQQFEDELQVILGWKQK